MRRQEGGAGPEAGVPPPLQRRGRSIRTEGPQGSPRLLRCRNTRNWRRLGKVMGSPNVPTRSSAFLASLAPLPSAMPRLRPQHWLHPWPRAKYSVQTPILPSAFPADAPLPILALPVGPISRPQHFLHFLHPPSAPLKESTPTLEPQIWQQTSNLNIPAGPHSPPRPLLTVSRPSQSTAFIIDLLPRQPLPLPAADPLSLCRPLLCHVLTLEALPCPAFTLNLFPYSCRHQK